MANKINLSDFFDFEDNSIQERFSSLANSLKNDYAQAIKELSAEKKVLVKNIKNETKALNELEKALLANNLTHKEGQAANARDAAEAAKRINSLKELKNTLKVVNKEQSDSIAKVRESAKATQESTKANKAAAGSIDELRQKAAAAKKQFESLGKDIDPFIKSRALENYTKYKQQLDSASASMRDAVKGNEFARGSYNALQKEVNELHKEYKNLPDALGKNRTQAEALRKTLFEKRQVLKDLDAEMNLHNRNVGNYGDSLKQAALGSNLFGGAIANAAQHLESTQEGLKLVTGGFKGMRAAIAATGIGALLIALGALVALFTKTDAGGERLERIFAGIGAVVELLVGKLAKVGEVMVNAFDNPKKTLQEFGDFLLKNIINRFTSFGVIIEGIKNGSLKQINDGFLQLATGVENASDKFINLVNGVKDFSKEAMAAANAAIEIKRALQELEDAERVYGVVAEKNRGRVEQLIKTSKDQTLSARERLNNLREAGRLEEEETKKQLFLAKQRLDIILRENALKSDLSKEELLRLGTNLEAYEEYASRRGTISDEDLDKQADAQRKLIEIQNASLLQQQEIRNRESQLIDDAKKELQDYAAAQVKVAQQTGKSFAFDPMKAPERAVIDPTKGIAEKWELVYKKEQEYLEEARFKGEITEKEYSERILQLEVNTLQTRLDLLNQNQASEAEILEAEIALWEAKEKQKTELTREQEEIRQELRQKAQEVINQATDAAFEVRKQQLEEDLSMIQEEKQAAIEAAGDNARQKEIIETEYDRKERKIKREIAKADRDKALFDIGTATAVAVMKALSVGPPQGFAFAAITAALGLAQAAIVLSKPLPKYAKGRDSGPDEFAIVDEQGPELIESKGKMYLGQSKGPRLTFLNKGDKVYTASQTKKILEESFVNQVFDSYSDGTRKLSDISVGPDFNPDVLAPKISTPIIEAIKNKATATIKIDKSGFSYIMKKGNMEIENLKGKYEINI